MSNFIHRYSYSEPRPVPEKRLGLVRLGAYGDALWVSAVLPHFKREGWHVTLYTHPQGEEALRHDPNIDQIICQQPGLFDFGDGTVTMYQTAYWLHEERKYDRFINMIGAVERRLLPQQFDPDWYLPFEQRHRVMNHNYLEALCWWCDAPFGPDVAVRFYPTPEELAWAVEERAKIDGPLVLINPGGTSMPKWWPYAQRLADALSAERVHSWIVGDLRFERFRESRFTKVVGVSLPIRRMFTLARFADAVVGTESALVNSVSYEPVLKIVLMSHSSHENLTKHWLNTIAVEPDGLPCYPCHRIHNDMLHCTLDQEAKAAACQAAAKPELVLNHILERLSQPERKVA